MRMAVISDVHGNRWALEAVLNQIHARGIERIVNLGDCVYGPLDPRGVAEMMMSSEIPTVRGNEDRLVFQTTGTAGDQRTIGYVRAAMTPEQLDWLAGLPFTLELEGCIQLFHGTPRRDDEYLLQVVERGGLQSRGNEEIAAILADVQAPIVLCGHDHMPGMLTLADGRLVVDPGSVGLPAFEADLPFPHMMQTGTPHARFCIVSRTSGQWSVEPVAVDYDWEEAAQHADCNGRPDWAAWLRTGRARQTQSSIPATNP